jgi:hypothetical protein
MRGVPVVNVDDHVIEIADAHAPSLSSGDARLPPIAGWTAVIWARVLGEAAP